MDRRAFLATAGTGLAASLAGCSGAIGAVAAPVVPADELDAGGWKQQGETQRTVFEKNYGPITLTAKAHSLTYGDAALRAAVKEKTLGRVDGQMALFSATRIRFDPDLTGLPGGAATGGIVDRTEQAARSQFESRMRDAGLEDVAQVDTGTMQVDTGETARLTTYEAAYPFDGVRFPVTSDQTVAIPGSGLSVAGELAVWKHGDGVLVAGGAYPAENFAKTVSEDLSSAISVTVDVDLGLTPDVYERDVRSLMRAVR